MGRQPLRRPLWVPADPGYPRAGMPMKTFKLIATVSSDSPAAVRAPLKAFLGAGGAIEPTDDGFKIEATLSGESAKDLNRQLLSELRRAEKKTRLRAEWTSGGVTEKFFDYVPKGTKAAEMGTRVTALPDAARSRRPRAG